MEIKYYPLDFDAIRKGDTFDQDQLRQITQCVPGTNEFTFAVLKLRDKIMSECEARGNPVTIAQRDGCLCVLTDAEAARYNPAMVESFWKRSRATHRRNLLVDTRQLTEDEKKNHDRNLVVHGAIIQGMGAARRKAIVSNPHERNTPGLAKE